MISPARRAAGVLLCLAGLAGCATRADLVQTEQDQRETRALLADQQVAIEGLRRRMDIMREGDASRGRGPTTISPQLEQRLSDLESRLAMLEQGHTPTPIAIMPPPQVERPPSERPAGETPRPEAAPTPVSKVQNPQDAALAKEEAAMQGTKDGDYREAMQLIRQGQCGQAVPALRDFIRKNPKSDFTDNAQYWIGSCYYSQHDYNRAIIELNEVLLKYPRGDKVPAALLMLADAFADSGDKIDARLILQKLISDHGRSEEAERGRQKLQSLGE